MAKDDLCYFTFPVSAPTVEMLKRGDLKIRGCIPNMQSRSALEEWNRYASCATVHLDPKDYVVVRGSSLGLFTHKGAEEFALDASDMTPAWTLVRGA